MAALVKSGNYGAINEIDMTTIVYYVIKFLSWAYTLQEDKICDGKISTSDELVFREQYINCIKDINKFYWEQTQQQQNIIVPTRRIVHPCLDIIILTEVKQTPKRACNRHQSCKAIKRHLIHLTDSDHYFILDEIKRRDTIKYEIDMIIDDK